MKHLTDEERLAVVEGRAAKESIDHLAECAECAGAVESWRRSIQRLENFNWPNGLPRRANIIAPTLKWAVAAGIVLCVGFGVGRFTGPDTAQIEATVKAQVSRDLQQQMLATLRNQSKSDLDPAAIISLLNQLREQQTANYVSLRKDLETLAATADARLQSQRRQILDLEFAGLNQTSSDPNHQGIQ